MEGIVVSALVVLLVVAIFFGARHFKKSSEAHTRLKEQLKSKYNLKDGRLFSLRTSDGRQIWFSIPDRDYFCGLATYGQDTIQNPSYCGVAVSQEMKDKYDFDFMLLNQNKPTQRINFMPFRPVDRLEASVTEKFHVVSNKKHLNDSQIALLNHLAQSLSDILQRQTRYEAAYRNHTLSVYVGAHFIKTFNELDQHYQIAMQCMDELQARETR